MRRIASFLFLFLLSIKVLFAQDNDCAALAQQMIEAARQVCSEVDRNQACYGSPSVEIEPRDNVRVAFSEPGDVVSLAALKSLSTSAFNVQDESGGITLLNIGGSFTNTSATLIAFGDVHLENTSTAADDFVVLDGRIGSTGGIIREHPSADSALVTTRFARDTVGVIGQLADSSWFRLSDGWVIADAVEMQGDLSRLPILEPDSQSSDIYGPMQSLRLHTGLDDSPCSGMPDSGLLVQRPLTPERAGLLNINGLGLAFTGTIWLQTTADGKTIVSVLEGTASYTEILWNAGESVQYGYQGDVLTLERPEDYNYARARYLPLQLLSHEFELPFSLGGIIFPFAPGTGFLNDIAADAACTVAWTVDVNIRSGPGTNYPIRRGVSGGFYGLPDARAVGTDGAVWCRLADSVWLAANNTAAGGACGSLPLVEPPPLPTNS